MFHLLTQAIGAPVSKLLVHIPLRVGVHWHVFVTVDLEAVTLTLKILCHQGYWSYSLQILCENCR